jgi:uncharacterized protein
MNYEQTVAFVRDFFDSHDAIDYRHPFRKRFEHCLRCAIWAERIAQAEGVDIELVKISALFHDIGQAVSPREGHGDRGAAICEEYLTSIGYDEIRRSRIAYIVRNHSQHSQPATSREEEVVRDSDLLDEVGAITILWDVMACARDEDPSYRKARDRIDSGLTRLKIELSGHLSTTTARKFAESRLLLVENFIRNLDYELGMRENI